MLKLKYACQTIQNIPSVFRKTSIVRCKNILPIGFSGLNVFKIIQF